MIGTGTRPTPIFTTHLSSRPDKISDKSPINRDSVPRAGRRDSKQLGLGSIGLPVFYIPITPPGLRSSRKLPIPIYPVSRNPDSRNGSGTA